KPTDLSTLLGYLLAPIAWVIGTPWQDATLVGGLIGEKVVLNEFVAYTHLADIVNGKVAGASLSDEGRLIATYALCGFANADTLRRAFARQLGVTPAEYRRRYGHGRV
ncbi:nucleoside transporter C-terminal domain-containing protein, partial [Lysobacter sp. 2RAB21]